MSTADVVCEVWSADVAPDAAPPADPVEARRWERMRRQDDRDRHAAGQLLVRRAAGAALGVAPERVAVHRRCPGCGSPEHGPLEVAGLSVSVSHGGSAVLVALTRGPAVGVDVEEVPAGPPPDVAPLALGEAERHEHAAHPTARDLLVRWVRKEAVLKATRQGLAVPMALLRVSAPDLPARLLAWDGPTRPRGAEHVALVDVALGGDRVACAAVLTAARVVVVRRT